MNLPHLPIDESLAAISAHLETHSTLLLSAPPGSGKTTRVAPYLLEHLSSLGEKNIVLLQPRRIAAKATATRIAHEHRWPLGGTVGYSVRFDSRTSQQTRLVVATEGILLRRLQADPILEDVGMVLLDEFHERSIAADLLLGMLRRIQMAVRPDLKILVMSATLQAGPLKEFLSDAPVVEVSGSLYPVETLYRPPSSNQKWLDHLCDTVVLTTQKSAGDILVFLPGMGEIAKSMDQLRRHRSLTEWDLYPLHGNLPLEEQAKVLNRGDKPRVILATNVAETSLTIEGITTVIDSGWARVLRFDPQIGLDRLELEPICQASATQRAGRAGRVQAGTCIRLWDQASQSARPAQLDPEIRRVDLLGPLLQLHQWGEGTGEDFPWLQPPRQEAVQAAVALLEKLGAIRHGQITPLGTTMAQLPAPPRLARLLIEGHRRGQLEVIAWIAALLSERDPFRRQHVPTFGGMATRPTSYRCKSDVYERAIAVRRCAREGSETSPFGMVHRGAARTIAEVAKQLIDETSEGLGPSPPPQQEEELAVCQSLLLAFPDRLAKRRGLHQAKGLMVGGKGVLLDPGSGVQEADLFLCIEVDGRSTDALVRQASAIDEPWIPSDLVQSKDELFYHPTQKQVVARRRRYYGDLILSETPVAIEDQVAASKVLYEAIRNDLRNVLPGDQETVSAWLVRARCLRLWAPELELPNFDDTFLMQVLRQLCGNAKGIEDVRKGPWLDWMMGELNPDQARAIQQETPERIQVPSGNWIRLQYQEGAPPILAVRIQEVFSWKTTPRIAFGRVPILLHLLAPNMRPQQVTNDLESFWKSTYETVRKELKRRYPKHHWPEDPHTAEPCSGIPKRQG